MAVWTIGKIANSYIAAFHLCSHGWSLLEPRNPAHHDSAADTLRTKGRNSRLCLRLVRVHRILDDPVGGLSPRTGIPLADEHPQSVEGGAWR